MTVTAASPQAVIEVFADALQAGRVDDLVALFEDDAVFVPQPAAAPIAGRAAIREAMSQLANMRPTMDSDIRAVIVAGDIATVHNAWRLEGTDAEGAPVTMAAISADVVRRRADGSWGILIDNPAGRLSCRPARTRPPLQLAGADRALSGTRSARWARMLATSGEASLS